MNTPNVTTPNKMFVSLQMQALQQQATQPPMYQAPTVPAQPPSDLDMTEFESLVHKLMESCTKDSISVSVWLGF